MHILTSDGCHASTCEACAWLLAECIAIASNCYIVGRKPDLTSSQPCAAQRKFMHVYMSTLVWFSLNKPRLASVVIWWCVCQLEPFGETSAQIISGKLGLSVRLLSITLDSIVFSFVISHSL